MRTQSLNGWWDWHLPHGARTRIKVPCSYPCVGEAVFEREFDLALGSHERAFLCFEGIHYTGHAELNNTALGHMLPYVPYRFDVTGRLKPSSNRIAVAVKDITADYGPTGGWQDYGGIGRDVFLEVRDAVWIEDIQWLTSLGRDTAECSLAAWISNLTGVAQEATVSVSLARLGRVVFSETTRNVVKGTASKVDFSFRVDNPEPWSPDAPCLYDLFVSVSAGALKDEVSRKVGIRQVGVDGRHILLNGEPIFLKGVARHEIWDEHTGFALSGAQIEQDLDLIKRMGANFVRLVHYPHSRKTIEYADRIGLMLCEEPGLWWSDMGSKEITGKALEIMRRVVLRDRNNPSVIAWLFFNECILKNARSYLTEGRDLCRSLDPSRLVSGANCVDSQEAKEVFDSCGFDFYTQHPYSYEPGAMVKALEVLRGKPLVFTEWGGWFIHNNPNLLTWFKKTLARYAHSQEPDPCLAGMCWWQWQDIHEFARGLPGCEEGLLSDGLVDRHRNRKPMYSTMAEFFDLVDRPYDPGYAVVAAGRHAAACVPPGRLIPLDLSELTGSAEQRSAWVHCLENLKAFQGTKLRQGIRTVGPIMPWDLGVIDGLPVNLRSGNPIVLRRKGAGARIPVGVRTCALHMIGHTTAYDGFPVRGATGEILARYVLTYDEGKATEVLLRNGIELASSSMIARHSRMNPLAAGAERALVLTIDPDWEIYQVNRFIMRTDESRRLETILFESLSDDFFPLLYGVTIEAR